MQIIRWLSGHRNSTPFIRMLELPVTASCSHKAPSIFLNDANSLSDLQENITPADSLIPRLPHSAQLYSPGLDLPKRLLEQGGPGLAGGLHQTQPGAHPSGQLHSGVFGGQILLPVDVYGRGSQTTTAGAGAIRRSRLAEGLYHRRRCIESGRLCSDSGIQI